MNGEKLSADSDAADAFRIGFNRIVTEYNYNWENAYSADESSMFWKNLPTKTLTAGNEKEVSGKKVPKDRFTIQVCADATGTHKIPLMAIGKNANPRCLKNIEKEKLPVIYYCGQKLR